MNSLLFKALGALLLAACLLSTLPLTFGTLA
jgi:hypothetical protein